MPYSKIAPFIDLLKVDFPDDAEEIKNDIQSFEAGYEQKKLENRDLSISWIGRVKGGKSSMVNALLFNGDQRLPEAAIPQTASLTYIRYAPQTHAVVHFYSASDWEDFKRLSSKLNQKIEECKKNFDIEEEEAARRNARKGIKYQKRILTPSLLHSKAGVTPAEQAAKEILENAKRNSLDVDGLIAQGKINIVENAGESIDAKLESYVGANGKFTPLVHHVELYVNDEMMRGYEIVDTPGTNDPIVSRGKMTMDSLAKTSVVIALSPADSFFDQSDLDLLSMLPKNGVSNLCLVASQYDCALKGAKDNMSKDGDIAQRVINFIAQEQESIKESFKSRIQNKLNNAHNSDDGILKILLKPENEPIFCSAKLYSIAKHWGRLSDGEKEILESLKSWCPLDLNAEDLLDLSGIELLEKKIEEVKKRKKEILEKELADLETGARQNAKKIVESIRQKIENKIQTLEFCDIEELRTKSKTQQQKVNSSRNLLNSAINTAIEGIEQGFIQLRSAVLDLKNNYSQLSVTTHTSIESYIDYEHRSGILGTIAEFFVGPKSVEKKRVVRTQTTDVVDAIRMVENFAERASNEFRKSVFENIQKLRKDLRNNLGSAILSIFDGDDEADIYSMKIILEETLQKVKITNADFTLTATDSISSNFSGTVENDDISALKKALMDSLRSVSNDLEHKISGIISTIQKQTENIKKSFVDNFIQGIKESSDKLCEDLKDKENCLKRLRQIQEGLAQI